MHKWCSKVQQKTSKIAAERPQTLKTFITHISFTYFDWPLVLSAKHSRLNTHSGNSSALALFHSQQVSLKNMFRLWPGIVIPYLHWHWTLPLQCLFFHSLYHQQLKHFSVTPLGEKRYEVNSPNLQGWRNTVSRVRISTQTAHWNQFEIIFNWLSIMPFTERQTRNNTSC